MHADCAHHQGAITLRSVTNAERVSHHNLASATAVLFQTKQSQTLWFISNTASPSVRHGPFSSEALAAIQCISLLTCRVVLSAKSGSGPDKELAEMYRCLKVLVWVRHSGMTPCIDSKTAPQPHHTQQNAACLTAITPALAMPGTARQSSQPRCPLWLQTANLALQCHTFILKTEQPAERLLAGSNTW